MSSVKCPQCNLTNWSTAITCKRCGYFLQPVDENSVVAANVAAAAAAPSVSQEPFIEEKVISSDDAYQDINQQAAGTMPNNHEQTQWTPPLQQQTYQEQNQQYQHGQQTDYQHQTYREPNYQYYAPPPPPANLKSGMAIASMILGILGFVTMIFLVGILLAPIGLILGIIALVKANKNPDVYGGRGFAIAGIVTSSIIVLFVPIISAIAIPNLLASRRAANEGSAISTLKTISAAEATYMASSYGKCADLQTLIATKLLDLSLASNEKNGYRFLVVNFPAGGCEIFATPLSTSQGTRSFYYSTEEGIIRGGAKRGVPADKNDFPIKNDLSEKPTTSGGGVSDNKPNEAAAIASLRTIQSAEISYSATAGQGEAGDLRMLAMQGLIKQDLADGEEYGYRFKVVRFPQRGWEIYATPVSSSNGSRSLLMGTEGVIRGGAKNGLPADKSDPPINF